MPFFDIVSVHHRFREFSVFSSGLLVYKERPRRAVAEELEIKSRSEGIDAFIKQAEKVFAEKGEAGLRELIAKNRPYWESIEENLKDVDAGQRERIKRLLAEIRSLQKQVVDLLPNYPVSKKVAVIVNGDSREERHTGNTERTIRVLRGLGFKEFFIAQDERVMDSKGVKQYPGSKKGMDRLFAELKGALKKDALVFMHGTGHGSRDEGGALVMDFVPVGVDEVKQYMQVIKGRGARIVGVFDSCYSGVFPRAIIEEKGLEGIVLSPGVENMETSCQAFTPYFFEGLEKGADMNYDNKTEVSEAFLAAMQIYCHRTGEETEGKFRKSHPELTLSNVDKLLSGKKPVLVMYTATWCPACPRLHENLHELDSILSNQVEIVTITDDTNPDAERLCGRLGSRRPDGFPAVFIYQDGKTESLFLGAVDKEEILSLLAARGIRPSEPLRGEAARALSRERSEKEDVAALERRINKETTQILFEKYGPNVFNLLIGAEEALAPGSMKRINEAAKAGDMERFDREYENLLMDYPLLAFVYSRAYEKQPYAERILGNAAEKFPLLAFVFFDDYRGQPYAARILDKAARVLANKKTETVEHFKRVDQFEPRERVVNIMRTLAVRYPRLIFAYFEHFRHRPYAELILTIAAEADPWAAIDFVESHKTLPYGAAILRKAQKSIAPK